MPPPAKALPPPPEVSDRRGHRRSSSNGDVRTKHASLNGSLAFVLPPAPRAPPPTGPLPPTPQDPPPLTRHASIKERLRLRSAPPMPSTNNSRTPSSPPPSLPGSAPLATVSSVSSLREARYPVSLGEPITPIPHDLNFLNMSPNDLTTSNELNFLQMASPLTASSPIQTRRSLDRSSPAHIAPDNSPPTLEMTVLPPPPRRSRAGKVKTADRIAESPRLSIASIKDDTEELAITRQDSAVSFDTFATP